MARLGEKTVEEGADPIDERVVGLGVGCWRSGLCSRYRGRNSRRSILRHNRVAFDAALKDECGAHANAPYQDDELRIEIVALHLGAGVIGKRWHEHLIDWFLFCSGRLLRRRRVLVA